MGPYRTQEEHKEMSEKEAIDKIIDLFETKEVAYHPRRMRDSFTAEPAHAELDINDKRIRIISGMLIGDPYGYVPVKFSISFMQSIRIRMALWKIARRRKREENESVKEGLRRIKEENRQHEILCKSKSKGFIKDLKEYL